MGESSELLKCKFCAAVPSVSLKLKDNSLWIPGKPPISFQTFSWLNDNLILWSLHTID